MLKKIGKILLGLLILLIGIGAYFYFFPMYSDYGISEEYFETRFHERGFDSPSNGIEEWKSLNEYLSDQSEVLSLMDAYYKCYYEDNCSLEVLGWENSDNKRDKLEEFLESSDYDNDFPEIITEVFRRFERIQEYEFVSSLNYTPKIEGELILGPELITYTGLIGFSRGLSFYNLQNSNKEFIQNYIPYYKFLGEFSNKLDDGLIGYLVIVTLGEIHFDALEKKLDDLGAGERTIILKNLQQFQFLDTMIENGLKADYKYIKGVYEHTFDNTPSTFKKKFFYSHTDTMNLLSKIYFDAINLEGDLKIGLNGRNLVGRLMLQATKTSYRSQFDKQRKLLEKREELIQLLSN